MSGTHQPDDLPDILGLAPVLLPPQVVVAGTPRVSEHTGISQWSDHYEATPNSNNSHCL